MEKCATVEGNKFLTLQGNRLRVITSTRSNGSLRVAFYYSPKFYVNVQPEEVMPRLMITNRLPGRYSNVRLRPIKNNSVIVSAAIDHKLFKAIERRNCNLFIELGKSHVKLFGPKATFTKKENSPRKVQKTSNEKDSSITPRKKDDNQDKETLTAIKQLEQVEITKDTSTTPSKKNDEQSTGKVSITDKRKVVASKQQEDEVFESKDNKKQVTSGKTSKNEVFDKSGNDALATKQQEKNLSESINDEKPIKDTETSEHKVANNKVTLPTEHLVEMMSESKDVKKQMKDPKANASEHHVADNSGKGTLAGKQQVETMSESKDNKKQMKDAEANASEHQVADNSGKGMVARKQQEKKVSEGKGTEKQMKDAEIKATEQKTADNYSEINRAKLSPKKTEQKAHVTSMTSLTHDKNDNVSTCTSSTSENSYPRPPKLPPPVPSQRQSNSQNSKVTSGRNNTYSTQEITTVSVSSSRSANPYMIPSSSKNPPPKATLTQTTKQNSKITAGNKNPFSFHEIRTHENVSGLRSAMPYTSSSSSQHPLPEASQMQTNKISCMTSGSKNPYSTQEIKTYPESTSTSGNSHGIPSIFSSVYPPPKAMQTNTNLQYNRSKKTCSTHEKVSSTTTAKPHTNPSSSIYATPDASQTQKNVQNASIKLGTKTTYSTQEIRSQKHATSSTTFTQNSSISKWDNRYPTSISESIKTGPQSANPQPYYCSDTTSIPTSSIPLPSAVSVTTDPYAIAMKAYAYPTASSAMSTFQLYSASDTSYRTTYPSHSAVSMTTDPYTMAALNPNAYPKPSTAMITNQNYGGYSNISDPYARLGTVLVQYEQNVAPVNVANNPNIQMPPAPAMSDPGPQHEKVTGFSKQSLFSSNIVQKPKDPNASKLGGFSSSFSAPAWDDL